MKDIMTNSILVFLIVAGVYLGGIGTAKINNAVKAKERVVEDTTAFDKKQIIKTKQDIDFTNTTQGDSLAYDSIEMKREADSIDDYMRYWYEVLDTNSDGEIDNDSLIEWLEE